MRYLTCFSVLLLLLVSMSNLCAQDKAGGFDRKDFYLAMRGNNEEAVNKQLALVKLAALPEKSAFEGALLMKKAGLVGGPGKKLSLFKDGHKKLESVLSKDSSNTELRFLRLMIQEHAPGILGYKKELQKDKIFIRTHYKKLPPAVQEAVTDYSKESKILKPADL